MTLHALNLFGAELAPSKIVCIASLSDEKSSLEEKKMALALQEIFYCRAALIPGLATLQTIVSETNPPYGTPLSDVIARRNAKPEEMVNWEVPHFSQREQAVVFAKKHDIDLLFFGKLTKKGRGYSINIHSTDERYKSLRLSTSEESLCDDWLNLICDVSELIGVKLTGIQREIITVSSGKPRHMDLLALGNMMYDQEVLHEYNGHSFDKFIDGEFNENDIDYKRWDEKSLEFWFACNLPEFFYKFSYYGIMVDNETRGVDFWRAIAMYPEFSKPLNYLEFNDPSILPYYILKENGYGTDAFLGNLLKFRSNPEFSEKVLRILEEDNIEDVYAANLWYSEQALLKDGDDYSVVAGLMMYYALKNDEASYKAHAIKLKQMYPRRADEIFEVLIEPNLEEIEALKKNRNKWRNLYSSVKNPQE